MTLTLGAPAAGWTVYMIVRSPDRTQLWNGTTWIADTTPNRTTVANVVAVVADGLGGFVGTFPTGITPPGVYPILAYRRIGGAADAAVDTNLLYDSDYNAVHFLGAAGIGDLPYAPFFWSASYDARAREQSHVMTDGAGRPLRFTSLSGSGTWAGTYSFKVYKLKDQNALIFSVAGVLNGATGDVIVNPTIAQAAVLDVENIVYIGQLWRTDGDDNTDVVATVLLRPPQ